MTKKIDIAAIPELGTSVGMHGSMKQKEVGGPLCLGLVVAIMHWRSEQSRLVEGGEASALRPFLVARTAEDLTS